MEMPISKTDTKACNNKSAPPVTTVNASACKEKKIKAEAQTFKQIFEKLHIAYENLTPVIDEIINNASSFSPSKLRELDHNNSPICSVTQEQYAKALKASMLIQEVNNELLQNKHDQKDLINGEIIHFPVSDLIKTVQNSAYSENDSPATTTHRIYIKRRLVEQFIKLYKLIHKVLDQLYQMTNFKPINNKKVVTQNNHIFKVNQDSASLASQASISKDTNLPEYIERLSKLELEYQCLNDTVNILKSFIQDTSTGSSADIENFERNQKSARKIKSSNLEADLEETKKITDVSGARRCILDCLFELAEARKHIKDVKSTKAIDMSGKVKLIEYPQQQCCSRQDVPHLHAKLNGIAVVLKLNKETVDTILSSVELYPPNYINEDNWRIECNKKSHSCAHVKDTTIKTSNQSTKTISSDATNSSKKENGNLEPPTPPNQEKEIDKVNEEVSQGVNVLDKPTNTLINNQDFINQFDCNKTPQDVSTLKTSMEKHGVITSESILRQQSVKNKFHLSGKPFKYSNRLKVRKTVSAPEHSINFHMVSDENKCILSRPLISKSKQQRNLEVNEGLSIEENRNLKEDSMDSKQIEAINLNSLSNIVTSSTVEKGVTESKTLLNNVNKKIKRIISPIETSGRIISDFELNTNSESSLKNEGSKKLIVPYLVGSKTIINGKSILPCNHHHCPKLNLTSQNNAIYSSTPFKRHNSQNIIEIIPRTQKISTDNALQIDANSLSFIPGTDNLSKMASNKNLNLNINPSACYSKLDYYANLSEKRFERRSRQTYEVRYFEVKSTSSESDSAERDLNDTNHNSANQNQSTRNANALTSMAGSSYQQPIHNVYMAKSKYYNYPEDDGDPARRMSTEEDTDLSRTPSQGVAHGQSALAIQPWAPFVTSDVSLPGIAAKGPSRNRTKENKQKLPSRNVESKVPPSTPSRSETPQLQQAGTPQSQQTGTPQPQQTGIPQFQQTGLPQFQQTGIPQFQQTGIPQFQQTGMPQFQQAGPSAASNGIVLLQPSEDILPAGYQYAVLLKPSQVTTRPTRNLGVCTNEMCNSESGKSPVASLNKSTKCSDSCIYSSKCRGVQTATDKKQTQYSQAHFPCPKCNKKKKSICTQTETLQVLPASVNTIKEPAATVSCSISKSTQYICRSESFTDCCRSNKLNTNNFPQVKEDNQNKVPCGPSRDRLQTKEGNCKSLCSHVTDNAKKQSLSHLHHKICKEYYCKDKKHLGLLGNEQTVRGSCFPNSSQGQTSKTDANRCHQNKDSNEKAMASKSNVKYGNRHPHVHYCFVNKDKTIYLPKKGETYNNSLVSQYEQEVDQKDSETTSSKSSEQPHLPKNLKITITANKCVTVDIGTQSDSTPFCTTPQMTVVHCRLLSQTDMLQQARGAKDEMALVHNQAIVDRQKRGYQETAIGKTVNEKNISAIGNLRDISTTKYADVEKRSSSINCNLGFAQYLVDSTSNVPIKQTCDTHIPNQIGLSKNLPCNTTNDKRPHIQDGLIFPSDKNALLMKQNNDQLTATLSEEQKLIACKHYFNEHSVSKSEFVTEEAVRFKKPSKSLYSDTKRRYGKVKNLKSILSLANMQNCVIGDERPLQFACCKRQESVSGSDAILHGNQLASQLEDYKSLTMQQSNQINYDTQRICVGSDRDTPQCNPITSEALSNALFNQTYLPKQVTYEVFEHQLINLNRKKHVSTALQNETTATTLPTQIESKQMLKNSNDMEITFASAKHDQSGFVTSVSQPKSTDKHLLDMKHYSNCEQPASSTDFQTGKKSLHKVNSIDKFQEDIKKEIEVMCNLDSSKYTIKISQLSDAATSTPNTAQKIVKNGIAGHNNVNQNHYVHTCKHHKEKRFMECLNLNFNKSDCCNKSTQLPPVVYRSKSFLFTNSSTQPLQFSQNSASLQAIQNTQQLCEKNGKMSQCFNNNRQMEECSKPSEHNRYAATNIQKKRDKTDVSQSIECIACQASNALSQPSLKSGSNTNSTFLVAENENYGKGYSNHLFSGTQLSANHIRSNTCWIPSDYDKSEFDLNTSVRRYSNAKENSILNQEIINKNRIEDTYCVHIPQENLFTKTSLNDSSKENLESFYVPTPFESNHTLYESYQYEINPDVDEYDSLSAAYQEPLQTSSSDDDSISSARQSKPYTVKNQQLVKPAKRRKKYFMDDHTEWDLLYKENDNNTTKYPKQTSVEKNSNDASNRSAEVEHSESGRVKVVGSSRSTVCWALTKVKSNRNGTQDVEIIETSPIPPGHFIIPSANSVILLGNQPCVYPIRKQIN